jgi:putative transposase
LRSAISKIKGTHPFEIIAFVLLPDHLHAIWSLPIGDAGYPMRWRRIKEEFTKNWLGSGGGEAYRSPSRRAHGMRGIWQKRYWEHSVSDETDLERCVDYIHWNPCKHRLVRRVGEWPWSSFHRFVQRQHYDAAWGGTDPVPDWHAPKWGGEL